MGAEAPARLVPVCQRNSRSTTETTQWVNSAEERSGAVGAVRGSLSRTLMRAVISCRSNNIFVGVTVSVCQWVARPLPQLLCGERKLRVCQAFSLALSFSCTIIQLCAH